MDPQNAFEELDDRIRRHRCYGVLTIGMVQRRNISGSIVSEIDDYVQSLDFTGLGDRWMTVSRQVAIEILLSILTHDLAYRSKMMEISEAMTYANSLLSFYTHKIQFFTNGDLFQDNGVQGWNPISKSTFDTGIVIVDEDQIGIVWVEDED